MSNFNQNFKTKGAEKMVDGFIKGIDMYTEKKLTDLKFEVIEESQPASYYIENGLSAVFKVQISYTIDYGSEVFTTEFEVPREIDGVFIIEGAYRIATNMLGNDYDCRINMSGTGRHYINFDYNREYDINRGVLKVKKVDPLLGLPERTREYKLEDIDQIRGTEREALKLTDKQVKKLQIKLDLDYKPEYITRQVIEDCIAYGDDRIKDLVIDKSIKSVYEGFMTYLFQGANHKNLWGTRRKIMNNWQKNKQLPNPIRVLSMLCLRHWKGSQDTAKGGNDVQISPGINAVNLQTLTNKIQIPESVAYNQTFTDLICVGDTPMNQNIGKQNSLTVSTHVEGEEVYFDVYDPKFTKITIPYLDYLNKKVCASEYVDYDTLQLKPDANNQVEVKYRMRRKMVPVSEVELIDLHPDYRLSEAVRRIPFLGSTDSIRIMMGSSMLKQSIPLVNAERPLVDTGNTEELSSNVLNEKFNYDKGKVKEITESEVIIELPNKETTSIPRRTAIQSVNDVDVFTMPKVKVGQTVRRGDIITGPTNLESDTYKQGLNALVLFHAMFGLVNEDALVVSESFAKRMKSYSIIDLAIDVKTNEAIKEILPIGSVVKSKDSVVTLYATKRLDEINSALNDKLGGLFGDGKDISSYTVEKHLDVPNNISYATVADVLVQENKDKKPIRGAKMPDLTFTRTSQKVVDEYMAKGRKEVYDKYPEYIAADRLRPINLDDKDWKVSYVVRVRLIMTTNLVVGSKVTNRYGGKGVISKVLPDEEMPIMVDGKGKKKTVEVVMNPYSTINRKISSVNMEFLLGNVAHKIHDLVDEYKASESKKSKIMPMIEKYYPRYRGMDVDKFIKLHDSKPIEEVYYFNVGSYALDYPPEKIEAWAKELGVKSQNTILMPAWTVSDMKELENELSPEEFEAAKKNLVGQYVPTDKPLSVGYVTLMELYHIPIYSNKVTSSMFGVDIDQWFGSPIMGKGQYRTTGQSIGEMELSAYLAKGATDFIKEARGDTAFEDNQVFLNNLLGLGLTVTDSKGYNQGGSSLKTRVNELKTKFKLKN